MKPKIKYDHPNLMLLLGPKAKSNDWTSNTNIEGWDDPNTEWIWVSFNMCPHEGEDENTLPELLGYLKSDLKFTQGIIDLLEFLQKEDPLVANGITGEYDFYYNDGDLNLRISINKEHKFIKQGIEEALILKNKTDEQA